MRARRASRIELGRGANGRLPTDDEATPTSRRSARLTGGRSGGRVERVGGVCEAVRTSVGKRDETGGSSACASAAVRSPAANTARAPKFELAPPHSRGNTNDYCSILIHPSPHLASHLASPQLDFALTLPNARTREPFTRLSPSPLLLLLHSALSVAPPFVRARVGPTPPRLAGCLCASSASSAPRLSLAHLHAAHSAKLHTIS